MLEILLVDDSEPKLKRIRSVLDTFADRVSISECHDIVSAKRLLTERQFDLMVLDVQLPLRGGQEPKKDGGIGLLQELHERSSYRKPACIVGLTQYEETLSKAEPLFGDKLWSVIHYDESRDGWSERIRCKVDYLLQTKVSSGQASTFDYDLAIITALTAPEFESVLRISKWTDKPIEGDPSRYVESRFAAGQKTLRVIAGCCPQMGMPAAAAFTTKLISHFHPKYLAIVGISAGVPGEVEMGDILIADPSWDWGNGKRRPAGNGGHILEPDPMPERLHPRIRALFMDVQRDTALLSSIRAEWPGEKPRTELRLHIGPCASGASVLADGTTIAEIKRHHRKLLGVDMEVYGVMHAASNSTEPRPLVFSMKAVCDFGDKKKRDSTQAYSAFVTANLLYRMALKYF